MTRLDSVQDGCWVNLTYPSEDELNTVAVTLGVEPSFLRAALDEEETSRIDTEDGQTLIIIDVPAALQVPAKQGAHSAPGSGKVTGLLQHLAQGQ